MIFITNLEINIMYWRKANAIHNWFVENVQEGKDDCGVYIVTMEQLEELYNAIAKVMKDMKKAPELLPTMTGFFFGNTDYNEFYISDLQNTFKALGKIIHSKSEGKWEGMIFEYHSSW